MAALKGPAMNGITIIVTIAIFAIGVIARIVVVAIIGITREEREFRRTGLISMTRRAPGRASYTARSLTGLYVGRPADLDMAVTRYEDSMV
jgi:hypothetical protein